MPRVVSSKISISRTMIVVSEFYTGIGELSGYQFEKKIIIFLKANILSQVLGCLVIWVISTAGQ